MDWVEDRRQELTANTFANGADANALLCSVLFRLRSRSAGIKFLAVTDAKN